MRLLERLRSRSSRQGAGDVGSAQTSSVEGQQQQNRAREEKATLVQAGIGSHRRATRAELDGSPVTKSKPRHSSLDRVDTARDQRNERAQLRQEARYRRERLDLYRARLYGGRAASHGKLRELQRASDGAAARLRRAEAAAPPTQPPA